MKKEIVKERVSLLEDYIDKNMKIEKLIYEKQMGSLNGRTMACPFHDDLSPSMFVDTKNNLFKCHSCGRGGRYVKLYEHWANVLDNRKLNYYEVLEEILRQDPLTSVTIGFHSIFKSKAELLDIQTLDIKLKERRTIQPVKEYELPETARMKIIVDEFKKGKRDIDNLLDIFAQVQKGNKLSLTVKQTNTTEENKVTSLQEIMNMLL